MTGYPFDPKTSFARHPGKYLHDAFGHTGADDVAAGRRGSDVCFRQLPHTGLDVSSKTPSTDRAAQMRTPVLSPVHGTIRETGSDPEAGLYHIIEQVGTGLFWGLGHHSAFVKRSGDLERGELIARMGMTGGAKGVHTHLWVATSLAAARDMVHGYVNLRKGRSVAAWAASEGLLDPWPLIEKEWAAHEAHLASLARADADRRERERAATAAAEAAAKAAAEAKAREDDMRTRRIQIGQDIYVSCIADGLLWHVPNTKAMPVADLMVDDPTEPTVKLTADGAAALFDAMDKGRDATERARLRTKLAPSK